MNIKVFGFSLKWVLIALAAIYLVSSYSFSLWPFDGQQQKIKQLEANQNVAEAQIETAEETIEVILDNAEEEKKVEEIVREATAAIDAADPQAKPEVTRQIVRRSVCQMEIYANDPQCVKDTQ